ncbi:MAG: response regulator transcription factor [Acetivibrionales bacterium]|jgi:DNA-binding NarL/FixJ family response regulator
MERIKVMIVDDQPIVREGLEMILSLSRDIEVVHTSPSGEEALKACRDKKVDVVLMDIRMLGMNGVAATKLIKDEFPQLKIIILTTFNDDDYIFEALKNGASSYLLKDAELEEIINAIKVIHLGGTVLHRNIAARVMERAADPSKDKNGLTSRETEICGLVAKGMSNREISKALYITEGTVKNHITNILSKLGLSHRTQIAIYIINNRTLL